MCQTLIVDDPEYAVEKKVEHDLWNVCFKGHIASLQSAAKDKTARGRKAANEAQVVLSWFLEMASGFYIMLLQEIRAAHDLNIPFLRKCEDFGLFCNEEGKSVKAQSSRSTVIYVVQHCLVHLGDIARYRNQSKGAEDFYRKAVQIAPGSGQAYNQIALLELNRGDKLSAVFFYARALAVRHPFPAAATNLSRLLDRIEQVCELDRWRFMKRRARLSFEHRSTGRSLRRHRETRSPFWRTLCGSLRCCTSRRSCGAPPEDCAKDSWTR